MKASHTRDDFPLRGLVRCGHCGKYLTSSYSTGKNKKYGYYRCFSRDCGELEVRSDLLESLFLNLLEDIAPSQDVATNLRDSILLAHRERQTQVHEESRELDSEIEALESRIFTLHESFAVSKRLTDPKVYRGLLTRYQEQLAEIRIQKEMLDEESIDIQALIDVAFHVLANARNLWLESSPEQRIRLQRTIFPDGVQYSKSSGFGTPSNTCGLDVLECLSGGEIVMAALREGSFKHLLSWLRGFSRAREVSA